MKNFKNWLFYVPVIGEIYLLVYWYKTETYPLNISSEFAALYQALFISILLCLLMF